MATAVFSEKEFCSIPVAFFGSGLQYRTSMATGVYRRDVTVPYVRSPDYLVQWHPNMVLSFHLMSQIRLLL